MRTLSLMVGLAAAFAACTPPKAETPEVEQKPQNAGPPARVDLPPLIKLEGTIPPETHPDGTMRVDGLVARREKYFGQKLVARGYLVEKYECPEDAKRCERPHAWLADTPAGGDKKLLLVGIDDRVRDALTVGEQYVVTGTFDRKSDEGFVLSTGLLVYESIQGLELPPEEDDKKRRR